MPLHEIPDFAPKSLITLVATALSSFELSNSGGQVRPTKIIGGEGRYVVRHQSEHRSRRRKLARKGAAAISVVQHEFVRGGAMGKDGLDYHMFDAGEWRTPVSASS